MAKYRRGAAVDSVDRRCQNWHRCSKCIKMDSGGECIPNKQTYDIIFDPIRHKFQCAEHLTGCQFNTCQSELKLFTKNVGF